MSSTAQSTKLSVMLGSLQQVFGLIPSSGMVDKGLMGMMAPVLEQGLVVIARKVDRMEPATVAHVQELFGFALGSLAQGLDDECVTVDEYSANLAGHLTELRDRMAQAKQAAA